MPRSLQLYSCTGTCALGFIGVKTLHPSAFSNRSSWQLGRVALLFVATPHAAITRYRAGRTDGGHADRSDVGHAGCTGGHAGRADGGHDAFTKLLERKLKEWVEPENPDDTNEQKYYRDIYDKLYPNTASVIPYFWMPQYVEATDSSARTLNVYKEV